MSGGGSSGVGWFQLQPGRFESRGRLGGLDSERAAREEEVAL